MRTIQQMATLRDLSGSLPALLNPLLEADQLLAYSRFFVFDEDGFGQYPRFKDWSDVSSRVGAFRDAIGEASESWSRFLAWWESITGAENIARELGGDHSRIDDARLYELLLTVMLNTPASWGDHIYWLLHRQKGISLQPCLARWKKDEPLNPWHVTVESFNTGEVVEIGQSDVTAGRLPDTASDLAPIFWDFLYPLCNREFYAPPQDPAKYATGSILEMILPVTGEKSKAPIGWAMCHVQATSDPYKMLASFTQAPITSILKNFEEKVRAAIQNE